MFWTDTTFAGVLDFYPEFSNRCLTAANVRNAMTNEAAALERASLAVYWSDWGARTAISNYDVDPAKVKVVPVGPSLDCNRCASDITSLVDARKFGVCELLFVGADWHRKGADTAIQVAGRLNKAGLKDPIDDRGLQAACRRRSSRIRHDNGSHLQRFARGCTANRKLVCQFSLYAGSIARRVRGNSLCGSQLIGPAFAIPRRRRDSDHDSE